jgi:hypothetical protein
MLPDDIRDPVLLQSQPEADPTKDAPVSEMPRSLSHLDAARADFKRLDQKSAIDHGCFNCGQLGTTFPCCNEVICDACARWFYPPDGHALHDHLREQPVVPETELQRLVREHGELLAQLLSSSEEVMRQKNDKLRALIKQKKEAEAQPPIRVVNDDAS